MLRESQLPSSLLVSVLSACGVVALAASALVVVTVAAAAAAAAADDDDDAVAHKENDPYTIQNTNDLQGRAHAFGNKEKIRKSTHYS